MRKMKRGLILLFALAVLTGLIGAHGVFAGVPQMINYQGTLTDKNGTSVPNGNYSIEFKIYDVASGGAALWSEKWDTTTTQIPVVGGNFNAMLGFQSPIPAAFFADHPVAYLGMKVGTDSEMLPRQQITSVGYAFTAGNGVPKKGIIMWSGAINEIPAGWALCDGVERTLPDGSKITPPDLRDRFIVGAGNINIGEIGGEATHILTIAEMPSHDHGGVTGTPNGSDGAYSSSADTSSGSSYHHANVTSSHTHNISAQGGGSAHNNLPPYYALAYIMKL
jgi:microcystin-dependent protein